jgi:hypothetical protein
MWGNCHLSLCSVEVCYIFLIMNSSKLNDLSLYPLSRIIACLNKYLRSLNSDEAKDVINKKEDLCKASFCSHWHL